MERKHIWLPIGRQSHNVPCSTRARPSHCHGDWYLQSPTVLWAGISQRGPIRVLNWPLWLTPFLNPVHFSLLFINDRSSKENTDKCDLEWWATCHCSHSCNPRPSSALRRWAAEALGSFFQVDSPTPPDQYLNCKVVGLRHNVTTFKSRVIRTVNVAFAAGGDRAAESIEWVLEVAKKRFPFI